MKSKYLILALIIAIIVLFTVFFIEQYFADIRDIESRIDNLRDLKDLQNEIYELKGKIYLLKTQKDLYPEIMKIAQDIKHRRPAIGGMIEQAAGKVKEGQVASLDLQKIPDTANELNLYKRTKENGIKHYTLYEGLNWPLRKLSKTYISCEYGPGYVRVGERILLRNHRGIDIVSRIDYKCYPAAKGIIAKLGYDTNYGNYIIVYHKELGLFTMYAHLNRYIISSGDKVTTDTQIAIIGNTGKYSTGVHLHFEVWVIIGNQVYTVNPVSESTYGKTVSDERYKPLLKVEMNKVKALYE